MNQRQFASHNLLKIVPISSNMVLKMNAAQLGQKLVKLYSHEVNCVMSIMFEIVKEINLYGIEF